MHSLHQTRKWQRDGEILQDIKRRYECQNNVAHHMKTRELANKYEMRVDEWLQDGGEKEASSPLTKAMQAQHHSFRDRNPKLELDHARISPFRYTPESTRIPMTIEARMLSWDKWNSPPSSLFRRRSPEREVGPTFRFKDLSTQARIEDAQRVNPKSPSTPWSQNESPRYHQFRDVKKRRWSSDADFNPRARTRLDYPHDYVAMSEPFAVPYGAKDDDYRPRVSSGDLAGEFYANVPGYFPDTTPSKWAMNPTLPLAGSPRAQRIQMMQASSPGNKVQAGRLVTPKTYWKASAQIQIEQPKAVDRYHTISERSWEQHNERAGTATRLIRQRFNLKEDGHTHTRMDITGSERASHTPGDRATRTPKTPNRLNLDNLSMDGRFSRQQSQQSLLDNSTEFTFVGSPGN